MIRKCKYCGKTVRNRSVCSHCYERRKKIKELIRVLGEIKGAEKK